MSKHKREFLPVLMPLALLLALLSTGATSSGAGPELLQGQTVYVPVYSHVYSGNRARPFDLAAILSVRNTDILHAITLTAVDYYNSEGKLVRSYLSQPQSLGGLATVRYVIEESDTSGGSGAKFIVRWQAAVKVNLPIIESVMIGTKMGQGISFTSRGQAIRDATGP